MTIIKKISAVMLALIMSVMCIQISFAEDSIFDASNPGDGITDKDGSITVKGTLDLPGGFPVTVFVAPRIEENQVDVTLDRLSGAATTAEFLSIVEYTKTFMLSEDGRVDLSFTVKDSMPTGFANVYLSYNGGSELSYIGYFEHVGKNDVTNLLKKFNLGAAGEYAGYIAEDIQGNEVLRKLSANVSGYTAIEEKTDFALVLSSLKGDGFTASTLVDSFNEAVAWMELREKEDTLSVLNDYIGLFWNVDLSDESDYGQLSETSKKEVLAAIKKAKLSDEETLVKTLTDEIALAFFREAADRNALSELLENASYGKNFEGAKMLINNAELNEYDLISVYNYVVDKSGKCYTKESMESLFSDAIKAVREEKKPSGGGGGGGGGFSGGKTTTSDVVLVIPGEVEEIAPEEGFIKETEHPFTDVDEKHWANDYIAKLYKGGIISGKTETTFAPEEKIVRQDFVKLVVSMLGLEAKESESTFEDVSKGSFYEPYIMAAVTAGIVNGVDEKTFGMSVSIKREDVAVIIGRILAAKGFSASKSTEFTDSAEISAYAVDSVALTAENGLFKGDETGNFNPKAPISRAEAAAVLVRLSETINK